MRCEKPSSTTGCSDVMPLYRITLFAKNERVNISKAERNELAELVDVSGLRQRLRLTQEQFAARFGFSVATLRHWERGDRAPSGASLVLLNVIDRNPSAVLEALRP